MSQYSVQNSSFMPPVSNPVQNLTAYNSSMEMNVDKRQVYLFTFKDIFNLNIQYTWLIDNILGIAETFVIVGQAGTGKSTFSLNMIFQLLTPGEKFLETYTIDETHRPKTALLIQAENTLRGTKKRMQEMINQRPQYLSSLSKIFTLGLGLTGKFKAIFNDVNDTNYQIFRDAIRQLMPDLIVIDPLSSYHNTQENDNSIMRNMLDEVELYIRSIVPEATIVVVHHHGRTVDKKQAGRGSSSITDWAANFATIEDAGTPSKKNPNPIKGHVKISFGKIRYTANDKKDHDFVNDNTILVPLSAYKSNTSSYQVTNSYDDLIVEVLKENSGQIKTKDELVSKLKTKTSLKGLPSSDNTLRNKVKDAIKNNIILENKNRGNSFSYSLPSN